MVFPCHNIIVNRLLSITGHSTDPRSSQDIRHHSRAPSASPRRCHEIDELHARRHCILARLELCAYTNARATTTPFRIVHVNASAVFGTTATTAGTAAVIVVETRCISVTAAFLTSDDVHARRRPLKCWHRRWYRHRAC